MKAENSHSFKVLLTFAVLVVIGAALLPSLNIQYLPSIRQQNLSIYFSWPDASASIIEREVTSRIEGAVSTVGGISDVTSLSRREVGYINLKIKNKRDVDRVRFEVASAIRSIHDKLPEGVSYPSISVSTTGKNMAPIMVFTVKADLPPNRIEKYVQDNIIKEISRIDGVGSVSLSGANPMYIEVSFHERLITSMGLTGGEIYGAVASYLAGREIVGTMQMGDDNEPDLVLSYEKMNLEELPVAKIDDRIIKLGDVATIREREKKPESYHRINGLNTINLTVSAEESVNVVALCSQVEARMGELEAIFPEGFSTMKTYDVSTDISEEIAKLAGRTAFCLIILLLFAWISTWSFRYMVIIGITLLANIAIAFIFYVAGDVDIHIYSLAGISISLSILIDNTIIMVSHYSRYRNRKVFLAILAALLTTIGSLLIVFFLPEQQQQVLLDFSLVIIINLSVSMMVALFFVPALLDYWPVWPENFRNSVRRRRRVVLFNRKYECVIRFVRRWNWAVLLLAAFMVAGSFMLFRKSMKGFAAMFRQPVRPTLTIMAGLPEGNSVARLNEVMVHMEDFLAEFDEVKLFKTDINSYRSGFITVEFEEDALDTSFPLELKYAVIQKAMDYGGANWSVYGIDDNGFSNFIGGVVSRSNTVSFFGYNYSQLYRYCEDFAAKLQSHPRVKDLIITAGYYDYNSAGTGHEYVVAIDYSKPALYQVNLASAYSAFQQRLFSVWAGSLFRDSYPVDVRIVSDMAEEYDLWHIRNEYLMVDSTVLRFSDIGAIERRESGNDIYRDNQEYALNVSYNFVGPYNMADRFVKKEIEELNSSVLPVGFRATSPEYEWAQSSGKQWALLLLIVAIIYIICAILFESLLYPLAIISLIPVSFTGIFLIFRLTETTFDQGGFASMIMLAGIVVNAGIYIVHEYRSLPKGRRRYVRAFNNKIGPISLTILSTVLGLIPFLFDGRDEVFWFAFAIGTMGGMLFSFVALLFVLPIFMPKDA